MKVLGVVQLQQKRFKIHETYGAWKAHLGDIPSAFAGIIYGESGNGKTEYCIRLAKYLAQFDKVAWLSYEQGHGPDLQRAINRNAMQDVNGRFYIIDPLDNRKQGESLYDALDAYLAKRSTPRFIFIDSLDYLRITTEEYFALKEKHAKKKGIVFISHAIGNEPKSRTAKDIEYDGMFGILVKKFIAHPKKNRLGGFEDYIIWEEGARNRNERYFMKKEIAM